MGETKEGQRAKHARATSGIPRPEDIDSDDDLPKKAWLKKQKKAWLMDPKNAASRNKLGKLLRETVHDTDDMEHGLYKAGDMKKTALTVYSKVAGPPNTINAWPPGQHECFKRYGRSQNHKHVSKPKLEAKAAAIAKDLAYVHSPLDQSATHQRLLQAAAHYLLLPDSDLRKVVDTKKLFYIMANSSYMKPTLAASNKERLTQCKRETSQALISNRQRSKTTNAQRRALSYTDGGSISYNDLEKGLGLKYELLAISGCPMNVCGGVTALEGQLQHRLMGTEYGQGRLFHCPMGYSGDNTPAKAYYVYLVRATKPMPANWVINDTKNGHARAGIPRLPDYADFRSYNDAAPPAGIEAFMILRGPGDTDEGMLEKFHELWLGAGCGGFKLKIPNAITNFFKPKPKVEEEDDEYDLDNEGDDEDCDGDQDYEEDDEDDDEDDDEEAEYYKEG